MTDNYGNASQPPQQPPGNPPPPPPPPGGGFPGPQGQGGYQPPPAGGYGQQPGQQPGAAWTQGYTERQNDNFFSVLFDFSFSRFITLSFAKFLFILYIIVTLVLYLIMVAVSFSEGIGFGLLTAIIGAPIALVYVIGLRMMLEFLVAQIRTAENTSVLVQRQP